MWSNALLALLQLRFDLIIEVAALLFLFLLPRPLDTLATLAPSVFDKNQDGTLDLPQLQKLGPARNEGDIFYFKIQSCQLVGLLLL